MRPGGAWESVISLPPKKKAHAFWGVGGWYLSSLSASVLSRKFGKAGPGGPAAGEGARPTAGKNACPTCTRRLCSTFLLMEDNTSHMTRKITYWLTTCLVAALGAFAGFAYLSGSAQAVQGFAHVGYPQQLRIILGIAKPLGAIALVVPGMAE